MRNISSPLFGKLTKSIGKCGSSKQRNIFQEFNQFAEDFSFFTLLMHCIFSHFAHLDLFIHVNSIYSDWIPITLPQLPFCLTLKMTALSKF